MRMHATCGRRKDWCYGKLMKKMEHDGGGR